MRAFVVPSLRLVFGVLAVAAIVYSCRINMQALASIGGPRAEFLAYVAVMTAAVKAAVPLCREYFGRVQWPLAALFALALVFDGICAIGFAAATRGVDAERRAADNAHRLELAAAHKRLQSELGAAVDRHRAATGAAVTRAAAALAAAKAASAAQGYPGRAAAVVAADIEAAAARAGDCSRRAYVSACQHVARLEIELADAKAREGALAQLQAAEARAADPAPEAAQLQAQIDAVAARLAQAPPAAPAADPFARALGQLARDVGLPVPDAWADRAFTVLLVAFIEILAICGLAAALAPVTPRPAAAAPPANPAPKAPPVRPAAAPGDVLTWLRQAPAGADGWIKVTQRALAADLSVSAAKANAALRALVAAGQLEMQASKRGTLVRVAVAST